MSYDVSIGREDFNYTYNVSKLFHDHIFGENATGLQALDGLTGSQAAKTLAQGFVNITSTQMKLWSHGAVGEPSFCAKYDAPNGWGSTVGALLFLANLMAACHANPRCKVRIS